jgi:hypothetical protein
MVDTSTLPPPLPWLPTTVHPRSVSLDPGEAESGVDFGFVQDPANATISGRVFNDLDGDRNDDGVVVEGGLNGPTRVFLDLDSDCQFDAGELFVFTTNAAGDYQFTGMPGGTYFVCVDVGTLPAPGGENWVLTSLNSNPKTIDLAPSSNSAGNVFGFQDQRASISGVVWLDNGTGGGTAGDGIRQPGETGRVSGVTMFDDLNNNGVHDPAENERVSNVTPVNGTFTVSNLGVGTHRLRILSGKPPAFGESTPVPLIVNVPSPTSGIVGADIGLQEMNGIIQGFVYVDLDGDGNRGPGENSPVTGATIRLDLDGDGFDVDDPFVVTDVSGTYTFTALAPGNYMVDATAPAPGSVTTTPNPKSIFTDGSSATTQDWGVTGVFGGVFYMTFATSGSLLNSDASALIYTVNDIIRLRVNTDGSWQYTIYFDGSNFGLTTANERIDAFYIVPAGSTPVGFTAGQILVSTAGAFSVQKTYTGGVGSGSNVSGFGEDVIVVTPTAYNGDGTPQSGTWALRFDGSTRRLTGTAGNIDALGLLPDGTMLLSTAGFVSGLPGSVTTYGEDIIRYNFVSRNYSRFFDGSQVGLSGASENVDGFFINGTGATPDIILTTVGSFTVTVDPVSGTSSDLVEFTPTSLGATTAGTFGPGLFLAASNFGHSGKNVKGIQLGLAPFDSPQLTAGARRVQDHDDVVVRWSEEVSQLRLYVDPTGLSADQAAAIRRAIGTASTAWQTTAGKSLLEVSNAGLADVIIRGDRTTAIGGKAQGVLGYTNLQYDVAVHGLLPDGTPYTEFVGREVAGPGSITFVVDWNWYTGVNPLGIKRGQYDLQTTALHELGHMLGLPDRSNDRRSAMSPRLSTSQTRRQFSAGDLSSLDKLYSDPAPVMRALAETIGYSARSTSSSARPTNDGQALNYLFADLDDSSNTLAKRRAAQLTTNLEQLWESPV